MKRETLLPIAVAVVSMFAGAVLFQWYDGRDRGVGSTRDQAASLQLHSIPLTDLQGVDRLLSAYRGGIIVVNFWAPWCAPCRREIPTLIELQRDYAAQGLSVLGLAFDGPDPVRDFAAEYAIDYPLFLAGNRSAMYNAAFDNPSGALPYTAVLDRELRIVFQHNGEVTRPQLEAALEPLMATPAES